jgi:small subunit ribosomal protein S18
VAKRKKPVRKKFRRRREKQECFFCKSGKDPNYKEYKILKDYVSDRAKIFGKDRTGVCSKHQRRLSRAIKRARHIGLLPFTSSL